MIGVLVFCCTFLLMSIEGTTTTPWPSPDPGVLLHLGGELNPTVLECNNFLSVLEVCKKTNIPDAPQPYGEPGRTGSYVTSWGHSAMVCGGYTGSSPPFSQFKDCQILDLQTKTWSVGPQLVNYTASRASEKVGDVFYIFGGYYPSNPAPGPTIWKEHNIVQALDLNKLEEGWRVVENVQPTPTDHLSGQELLHFLYQKRNPTTVIVPSRFFPSRTATTTTMSTPPVTTATTTASTAASTTTDASATRLLEPDSWSLITWRTTISTTTTTSTTASTPTPCPGVQMHLGGRVNPRVTVTKNGRLCQNVKISDVPQPYGWPGRKGSYVTSWGHSAMVCGGHDDIGPPWSQFDDCQILDLVTKTWSLGPQLVKNTANRKSVRVGNLFYIFGGSYPSSPYPGPTVWIDHDIVQLLDLDNLEKGWRIVEEKEKEGAYFSSTSIAVPETFFQTCEVNKGMEERIRDFAANPSLPISSFKFKGGIKVLYG